MNSASTVDHGDVERRLDDEGRAYARKELNGHWVQYTFYDDSGEVVRSVAFPRLPIISDKTIELIDQEDREEVSV